MKNLNKITGKFKKDPALAISWVFVLAVIPVISFFGRSLQHFLEDVIGTGGVAWVLGLTVGVLLMVVAILLVRKAGWVSLLNLIWLLLFAAGLMFYLRANPERWYHIPLFGLLGFLSVSLFSVRTGIEIALAWAVLDEFFQHYLSNRVGDFEDVLINAICGAAGIILYLILHKKKSVGIRDG
jgi:hypothetical protein